MKEAKADRPAADWPPVDWAGHEQAQRRRYARLTLAEKLEWLEQAHRLARQLAGGDQAGPGGGAVDVPDPLPA